MSVRLITATRVLSWAGTDIYAGHVAEELKAMANKGFARHLLYRMNDRHTNGQTDDQ